jgi:hypothetical protein
MRAAAEPRLPGVYFLPPLRAAGLGFPPLDVAAFVGFAERGPLHLPVPVEDVDEYQDVFGGELPLALEPGGRTVYANLPRAVAGFFANGGRRCYVIRVAGEHTQAARFRLPGMVALAGQTEAQCAAVQVSSPGFWASQWRLGTRLQSTQLPVAAFRLGTPQQLVWTTGSAPQAIQQGDILHLTGEDGQQWLFPVSTIQRPPGTTPAPTLTLVAEHTWQWIDAVDTSPPLTVEHAQRLTLGGAELLTSLGELLPTADGMLALTLTGAASQQVQRGDILRLHLSDGSTYLFPVTALRPAGVVSTPPTLPGVLAVATGMLRLPAQPLPAVPPTFRSVARLRFDLRLQQAQQRASALGEMAFNLGHPRFWGEVVLLESSPRYRQAAADASGTDAAHAARLFRDLRQDARNEEAQNGRLNTVALAGVLAPLPEEATAYTYVPLGMPAVATADDLIGPDEAGDDDLASFGPGMFLDDYLVPEPLHTATAESARTLMTAAFDRYYVQNRRLHGLHSLLFVDEVALIAIPDAVHRGWLPAEVESPPSSLLPVPTPPLAAPVDWSLRHHQ